MDRSTMTPEFHRSEAAAVSDIPFILRTLAQRKLARPGRPDRVFRQLATLRTWGYSLAGELRAAAARWPNRVAIVEDGRSITYRNLVLRSDRIAAALRLHGGVESGDRVGLLCRNHGGMVELMIALTVLGADPVLVNTGLSEPQLVAVAEQQQLRLLCHDAEFDGLVESLPESVRLLPVSMVDALASKVEPGVVLKPPARDGRIIVLTSGTTGTPKGARRPVPPGLGPLASVISRIPVEAGERMFIAAPLFHTWGLAALQMSFALSGTTILQRRFEPRETLDLIIRSEATALFVVPVMLQRLLEIKPRQTMLRVVAASGSALSGGLATQFMDAYGDVLYNLYGSTEASWASIATPAELRRWPGTAGRPPHGTQVAILGPDGRRVPDGEVGRIFVGNTMLFEGYTSGTSKEIRNGLLSTGDLGHVNANGQLFVDGREDDMIISGGENVFPLEVEDLLGRVPQIYEVAVIGVPDAQYGQRLAAYVVLRSGHAFDAVAIREHVRQNLARFCVPRDVVFLEALPRNATGKVVPRLLPPV
jgi:acyl-CoA synthetase (AMP-forming)/AMP-acid ligase II